jgi:carbon monoxide dehydrogenase subunit G
VTVVTAQVTINASPAQVWKVVADPRNLTQWDRHIVGVRGVPPNGISVGTEYVTDLRLMGVVAHVKAKVVSLEKPRHALVAVSGVLEGSVETTLERIGKDRTRLSHRVEYRFAGGPLGALAATAMRRLGAGIVLRRGAIAQKRQAEGATARRGADRL